jgi:hypothetical protein
MRVSPWLIYAGLIGALIVSLAYYRGFTSDVNAVGPYAIKLFELGQGRNPATGNFSNYPQ